MGNDSKSSFGKIRAFLWPIHAYELKKLIPLLLIISLLTFNYNILRTVKESLIITAKSSGAEVIPFLKVWAILPMAFLLTVIFTRLANHLNRERIFYTVLGLFLGFYSLFTFVLYPLRDSLHPHQLADYFQAHLPAGFKGLIAVFRYWTYTLFYCMAELWGTTILFLAFWGFVNQVIRIDEAKRFYGILGLAANFAGIPAGGISYWLSKVQFSESFPLGSTAWEQSLIYLTLVVLVSGVVAMLIFRWLNQEVLTDARYTNATIQESAQKPTFRMSLNESFRYLAKSKYLICIALIVLAYNIVINLTEVVWKDQVKQLYPTPSDYNAYMSHITTITGIIATITGLFITGNVIRKCGWTFTALISPAILLITSIGFFSFFLFQDILAPMTAFMGVTPLAVVVFFGSAQNCLSRAGKYSLFDATKELAFTPLTRESKLKGKAAIDGVGSRLGKSGGAIIHQGLLIIFATITAGAPYVAGILLLFITAWIVAVRALGKQFNELVRSHEILEIQEPLAAAPAPKSSAEALADAEHPVKS